MPRTDNGNYTHFTAGRPELEALVSGIKKFRGELLKHQSAVQEHQEHQDDVGGFQ